MDDFGFTPEERLQFFFEPCKTREELKWHIKAFLQLELPEQIIDEDSTSSSFDFVWSVYQTMLTGKGETRHVVAASRNTAKCLAEGTLVATPTGPAPIEKIKVGDTVFDENGKPIKVVGVWDQGEQECVTLFQNKTEIATCTKKHVWSTFKAREFKDRKVEDFSRDTKIKRVELNLPLGSINEPKAYALGALAGDGCSRDCGLRISDSTGVVAKRVADILGTTAHHSGHANHTWIISSPKPCVRWVWSDLYENGMRGKYAHEKTIPMETVKSWDRKSLLAFVAGVLDTDGSVFLHKKQIHIKFGMQALSIIEAIRYAFMALWQIDLKIKSFPREYKNGPIHTLNLNHIYHCKRALKELDPFLVVESKKWKPEYETLKPNNFNPRGFGVTIKPAGIRRCYDLTVDSEKSLYCLQNGAVTHNTLSAVVIRFYGMIHFRRNGTHLAANLEQSKSANSYLDKFFRLNNITAANYLEISNTREKKLSNLPPNSYTKNSEVKLQIAVATVGGVNSQRGSLNTRDELDLIPPAILSEAAFIADPTQDEHMFEPIELNLSSRKSNSGPIQDLVDEAEKGTNNSLRLHKWSTVDWMRKCEPAVHQPEKPRVKAWLNVENLQVTWDQENFDVLTSTEKALQKEILAYEGCRTCPVFSVCQARSPNQEKTSRMLRSREFVDTVLQMVKDPEKIIAQSLNWRPESSAVIFRFFNRRRHFLKPIEAWKWLFGSYFNPFKLGNDEIEQILRDQKPFELAKLTPTKPDFYNALIANGWKVVYGVDWGVVDQAVALVIAYHKRTGRAFFFHIETSNGHSNEDWARHIHQYIYPKFPCEIVAPDMADAAAPIYFRKLGIPSLDKKPPRIETGVSQLRGLLWNVESQRERMILLDDGELGTMKWVAECFEKWTWAKNATGFVIGKFDTDSEYTHPLDAARYALDQFIDHQVGKFMAAQPKTKQQAYLEAAAGRPEELRKMTEVVESDAKTKLAEHLSNEFGLVNIYAAEEELKKQSAGEAPEPPKPGKPGKALKFSF